MNFTRVRWFVVLHWNMMNRIIKWYGTQLYFTVCSSFFAVFSSCYVNHHNSICKIQHIQLLNEQHWTPSTVWFHLTISNTNWPRLEQTQSNARSAVTQNYNSYIPHKPSRKVMWVPALKMIFFCTTVLLLYQIQHQPISTSNGVLWDAIWATGNLWSNTGSAWYGKV